MNKKNSKRKKSLLRKNIIINVLIVVLLTGILGTVSYMISASKITDEIESQISLQLEKVKSEIKSVRESQVNELSILSNTQEAVDVLNGGDSKKFGKLAEGLEDIYSGYLENVIILDGDGIVIIDSNYDKLVGTDLSAREYFKTSINGSVARSDIIKSTATGNFVEATSVPIKVDGTTQGVLITSMNMEYVGSILSDVLVGDSGYAFLLDQNGKFIYHPNSELMGTSVTDLNITELTEALDSMLAGETGKVYYTYNGVSKLNMFEGLDGWSISVNAVESEYLSAVAEMLKDILIVGIIMIFAASAVTGINSYHMVKRIKKVQHVLGEVTEGNMTVDVEEKNLKKCWEIMECSQPDCPAYNNDDRKCWDMNNTCCGGEIQSDSTIKLENCKNCKVYRVTEGDEISQMTRDLGTMVKTIRNLIFDISETAEKLSSSGQQLLSSSEETTVSAENIAERMEDISSNSQSQTEYMESINDMAHQMIEELNISSEKMNFMASEAENVNEKSRLGREKINTALKGMENIKDQTEKIGQVMEELVLQSEKIGEINMLITNIAEETNLLSLNASIEAARAGENGKGFGVVADQIGKLAAQSQGSAEDISKLIENIKESIGSVSQLMDTEAEFVHQGIESVNDTDREFDVISRTISELMHTMREVVQYVDNVQNAGITVSDAVERMSGTIQESSANMEEVTASTEEQSSISEEIAGAANDLASMAEELVNAVTKFKV